MFLNLFKNFIFYNYYTNKLLLKLPITLNFLIKTSKFSSFFNNFLFKITYHFYLMKKKIIISFFLNLFDKSTLLLVYFIALFFLDFILDSDEPLWEPIEWSFVQNWILIIFSISWICENLILSRFGSFSNHDKKIWFSWFKTLLLIEFYFFITLIITIYLIIIPFYFEITYNIFFIILWWNWLSKFFFAKLFNYLLVIFFLSLLIQIVLKNHSNNNILFFILINILFIFKIFFIQFFLTIFCFLTDQIWYVKNKNNTLIQISHEPQKWGWGFENKDHFQYHSTKTTFWFKNDGPFAESLFLINFFILIFIISLLIFWLILFKKLLIKNNLSYLYVTITISFTKFFFILYNCLFLLVISNIWLINMKNPYEFFFYNVIYKSR